MGDSLYRYFNCSSDPITFHCYTWNQFTVTIPQNAKFDFVEAPWESCVSVFDEKRASRNEWITSVKIRISAHHYPQSKGTYVITKQFHIHFISSKLLEKIQEDFQNCQLNKDGYCQYID